MEIINKATQEKINEILQQQLDKLKQKTDRIFWVGFLLFIVTFGLLLAVATYLH